MHFSYKLYAEKLQCSLICLCVVRHGYGAGGRGMLLWYIPDRETRLWYILLIGVL